jgi:hypothetical protein
VIFWTSTIATWCVNMPVAYVGGITLGFGFPALWCGVLFMEIAKLLMYATCLARVDWCAVHAMEVTPKETQAELEKCAVNYITAVVRAAILVFSWSSADAYAYCMCIT